jgi:sec-independent protein translocase protein TatA
MQGIEWIVLLVAIVIIFAFGGKKIPELARSLGRAKGEFEKGKRELEKELKDGEYESTTKPKSESTSTKEEDKFVKAAKDLGIETEGKNEDDLKKEIAQKMV